MAKKRRWFKRSSDKLDKEIIEQNQVTTWISPPGLFIPESKVKQPILGGVTLNQEKIDEFIEDAEIRRLQLIMIQRTPQNMQWLFDHDNSCNSASFMLAQAVKGEQGLIVSEAKSDKLKEIIVDYLESINYRKIIDDALRDGMIHKYSIWWLEYDPKKGRVTPKWINLMTCTEVTNLWTNEPKWIQYAYVDSNMPMRSDNSAWRKYEPYLDLLHHSMFTADYPKDKPVKKHIMLEDVLWFNFFKQPPFLAIADIVLWKKWMQYDTSLGSKKFAMPILDAEIDLPENYELGSEEQRVLCDTVAEDLVQLMNFGVLAHPAQIKVSSVDQGAKRFEFTQLLEYADKMIHKSLFVPVNLVEASGAELATSRTTKDMFSMSMIGIRHIIIAAFTKLVEIQLDFIGRKETAKDFKLSFQDSDQQQKMTQREEFDAIMQLHDRGITKDENEVRAYVSKFGIELEPLSEGELMDKEIEKQFEMLGGEGALPPQANNNVDDAELERQIMQDSLEGANA